MLSIKGYFGINICKYQQKVAPSCINECGTSYCSDYKEDSKYINIYIAAVPRNA